MRISSYSNILSIVVVVIEIIMCSFSLIGIGNGEVYKVGDSAGWTTIGNVDYKLWASTKTFQLGDLIVFEYNPQFHNVMQVIHSEYKACNVSSPISTHTTGNDSITINNHGHHFFVCGVPGHCQSGQKLDINVLRSVSTPPTNSQSQIPAVTVPAPSPSAAPSNFEPLASYVTMFYLFISFLA